MAKQMTVPSHITRPGMARECVAAHSDLDISAWIMATGRERLVFNGIAVGGGQASPRQDVFAYQRGNNARIIGLIRCLYKMNIKVRQVR